MFDLIFNKEIINNYQTFSNKIIEESKSINEFNLKDNEYKNSKYYSNLAIKYFNKEYPFSKEFEIIFNTKITETIKTNNLNIKEKDINPNDSILVKQKLMNAYIQGAAYKTNKIFYIIDEYSKKEKENFKNYFKFIDLYFYMNNKEKIKNDLKNYNTITAISHLKFTDTGKPMFFAQGNNTILLIHELVKNLYTLLSLNAYNSINDYYNVTKETDNLISEIDDIKFGNYLYSKTKDYLIDNYDNYYDNGLNFFEMFFVTLCKQKPNDFIQIVNNILLNRKDLDIENICRDSLKILKNYESEKYFI